MDSLILANAVYATVTFGLRLQVGKRSRRRLFLFEDSKIIVMHRYCKHTSSTVTINIDYVRFAILLVVIAHRECYDYTPNHCNKTSLKFHLWHTKLFYISLAIPSVFTSLHQGATLSVVLPLVWLFFLSTVSTCS